MFPHDRIRSHLIRAREIAAKAARDAEIIELLVQALIEGRRTGHATEAVMRKRFGFTAEELKTYGTAAVDAATQKWIALGAVDRDAA